MIRSLICTFVGHVDHGKTSVQDYIRETSIVAREPGRITQHISASKIPSTVISKISQGLIDPKKLRINSLIFLDTPGHASFTNLRKRGGNLADIAVLVVDINEGFKPQTIEAIEILKNYKTPFIIAANKIDLINGYRSTEGSFLTNFQKQQELVMKTLEDKLYKIVASISTFNLNAERFDRVDDYTKQVAIIPISAKTGEGIPELLAVLVGLAQKFLEKELEIDVKNPGQATVLEVIQLKGKGTIIEAILYDGSISEKDTIVIGGIEKPVVTKVKAIYQQLPLRAKYELVKKTSAADVIRISCGELDNIYAGMPIKVATKDLEKIKNEIQKEVNEVLVETDSEGIIIKADSLGTLEALTSLLKERNVKIKRASIGNITKRDISEAKSEKKEFNRVILGFNVKQLEKSDLKVINGDIIYKIIDDFDDFVKNTKSASESKELKNAVLPCKILLLEGFVFRQSSPAVLGVEVLGGKLKVGMELMKEGKKITEVKSIQEDGENINEVGKGKQVAVAFPNVTVGRQIHTSDILYSLINEEDFKNLKNLKKYLSKDQIEVLKEIVEIMRKTNALWGV